MKQRRFLKALAWGILFWIMMPGLAIAAETPKHSSSNYGVQEFNFSSGDQIDASSASFEARTGVGDIGVGFGTSANFEANAGFVTTADPFLEFSVTEKTIDFGEMTTSTTGTGTANFSIRSYLSSGYDVTVYGTPPSNSGHIIANLATQTASSQGTEQFGMNLVANTLPTAQGANPVQVPDSSFSFGFVNSNYGTADQYRYVSEDIVASSNSSTGQTDFTASYILNVGPITPGGIFTMTQSFVAVPTF